MLVNINGEFKAPVAHYLINKFFKRHRKIYTVKGFINNIA